MNFLTLFKTWTESSEVAALRKALAENDKFLANAKGCLSIPDLESAVESFGETPSPEAWNECLAARQVKGLTIEPKVGLFERAIPSPLEQLRTDAITAVRWRNSRRAAPFLEKVLVKMRGELEAKLKAVIRVEEKAAADMASTLTTGMSESGIPDFDAGTLGNLPTSPVRKSIEDQIEQVVGHLENVNRLDQTETIKFCFAGPADYAEQERERKAASELEEAQRAEAAAAEKARRQRHRDNWQKITADANHEYHRLRREGKSVAHILENLDAA